MTSHHTMPSSKNYTHTNCMVHFKSFHLVQVSDATTKIIIKYNIHQHNTGGLNRKSKATAKFKIWVTCFCRLMLNFIVMLNGKHRN